MIQFRFMVDARRWLEANATGPCTVVIHGDPYEYKQDSYEGFVFDGFILERQYSWDFVNHARPVFA